MSEEMKVRIALVGLNFGANWVSVYKEHPNVEYVALCDTNQALLDRVADEHRIERRYTEMEPILESDDYEDAIRKAISLGGDSDTIACIAGGIAQAYYREIPRYIIREVKATLDPELLEIIDQFTHRYNP